METPIGYLTNRKVHVSRKEEHSWALYVFFSVGMLFAMGGFGLQLSGSDLREALRPSDTSIASQVIVGSIFGIALIILVSMRHATAVIVHAWPIFLLPALAILSAAWAPDVSTTLRRSAAYFGTILFGFTLATRFSTAECVRLIIATLSLATFLSLVWVFIFPAYAVNQATDAIADVQVGMWRGIFGHKNSLGYISGLTFAFLVVYGRFVFQNWALRYGALAVSLVCLIGAKSSNGYAIAAIIPCVVYVLSFTGRVAGQLRALVIVIMFLAFAFLALFLNDIESFLLWALDRQADFTGRVPYWNYIVQSIDQEHLLLGYGYTGFSFTLAPVIFSVTGILMINAHNGYIEILVAFGYVGIAIFAFVFVWMLWQAWRMFLMAPRHSIVLYAFPLSVIALALLSNVVESSFLSSYYPTGVLLGAAAGMCAREGVMRSTTRLSGANTDTCRTE